jgi:peptidoglycan/LPS O-acetylase OafA/YrhL
MTTPTPAAALQRSGSIPSLDGIRALAVSMVLLAHSGLEDIVPGGLGVTVFFVLSGYLISTLMRSEQATTGTIDFQGFYLRRFIRLMPPLAIVTVVAGLLAAAAVIDGGFTGNGLLAVLFYYGNYFVIAHDFNGLPAGLGVVWSLAVEEHFYLLYPPLAALLLKAGRPGVSAATLLSLCGLVLAWRCWLVYQGASDSYITMSTDTRIDAILVGCLMALWRNPWLDAVPPANAIREGVIVAVCVGILLATLLYRNEVFRQTLRYTVQSLAVAPLISIAITRAADWPFRWLNARPLVYVGTISYTLYLSHHVILLLVEKHWPALGWTATLAVTVALSLLVGELMRRAVDLPCARLRKRLHGRRRPFAAVIAAERTPATPGRP